MLAGSVAKLPSIEYIGKEWVPKKDAENMSDQMVHILKALPSGVIILNSHGVIVDANPAAIQLLNCTLVKERWIKIIEHCFAPQKDDGYEVSLKNGRQIKLTITPLNHDDGQLIVLTDLTETRLLQKNISHMQRLSALGEMVARLAHQVRTPLSAAVLYASNLANNKLQLKDKNKFQKKLLERLNELEHQVNDMLLMAQGQHNEITSSVSADDICQKVIASSDGFSSSRKVKINFINNSSAKIMANLNTLSSAINNLVINSIEAGANVIELQATNDDENLSLTITDNGKGINNELKEKILAPFFTTKPQGTGLGLAVVQSVVKRHSGKLDIQCNFDKGCQFCLIFPRCDLSLKSSAEENHQDGLISKVSTEA